MLVLVMLCWGANTVFGQLAVGHVTPAMVVFLRWAMVTAFLWPFFGHQVKADWPIIREKLPLVVLMASLGYTGFNTLFYAAAHTTSAINVGIIQGSMPVFVLLGAWLALGTKVTGMQWVGAALGLLGVAWVAAKGRPETLIALDIVAGDGLMLLAAGLYSFYTIALNRRPPISGISFFTLMAPIAMLTALPLVIGDTLVNGLRMPTLQGWVVTALIAIFPSCLAQLWFMRCVDLIGPGRAGVYMNLTPVFAAMMGVAFLGEQFFAFHALGLLLVISGIWLVQRQRT